MGSPALTVQKPGTLCPNCQTSKPKGVLSAFMCFSVETHQRLKEESKQTLSITEVSKQVGVLWGLLKDKTKFDNLHEQDVLR